MGACCNGGGEGRRDGEDDENGSPLLECAHGPDGAGGAGTGAGDGPFIVRVGAKVQAHSQDIVREINGRMGIVTSSRDDGRFVVLFADPGIGERALLPAHLYVIPPIGLRVKGYGLVGMHQLNGQLGTVTSWCEERWGVHFDDAQHGEKSLLPRNLRPAGPKCVVCGRNDRLGDQRKSGFKCHECVGVASPGARRPAASEEVDDTGDQSCVVCGRNDRAGKRGKAGFKCHECVGKMSNPLFEEACAAGVDGTEDGDEDGLPAGDSWGQGSDGKEAAGSGGGTKQEPHHHHDDGEENQQWKFNAWLPGAEVEGSI